MTPSEESERDSGLTVVVVALEGVPGQLRDVVREELETSTAITKCRTIGPDSEPWSEDPQDVGVLLTPIVPGDLAPDLAAVTSFLETGGAGWARRWVVLSSAAIHDPNHRHPGMALESQIARTTTHRVAKAWRQLEALANERLAASLTILRPAAIPTKDGHDFISRLLRAKSAMTVAGYNPPFQLLSAADLARAVRAAVEQPTPGVFHVAPKSLVALRRTLSLAGVRRWPMPGPLHRLGAPSDRSDYLRWPWTISGETLGEQLGWFPEDGSAAAAAPGRSLAELGSPDDDHGMDRDRIAVLGRRFLGFLHDRWWRVEWRGLEHVPQTGGAVLAGIHRGHQPWDGVMILYLIYRELGRVPRFLTHPTLLKFPFLASFMRTLGGVPAFQRNADRALEDDSLLAIFPEGIQGAFRYYRDAYTVGSFGRHDYVQTAIRHQVPIVPFVTVGSAEAYPLFGKLQWRWWRRWSEWPCLPITPTMSLVPLPSKWHTLFLEPIPTAGVYPPEAAKDRKTVRVLSQEIKNRMQTAMIEMREKRPSIWWGSVFDDGS